MSNETQLILDKFAELGTEVREEIGKLEVKVDEEIGKLRVEMDEKFGKLEAKMDVMQRDLTGVKLRIENEISVSIKRVAEGHLDLSRNLHEAMKPNSEVEMLSIRVGMLESEVSALKQKIS